MYISAAVLSPPTFPKETKRRGGKNKGFSVSFSKEKGQSTVVLLLRVLLFLLPSQPYLALAASLMTWTLHTMVVRVLLCTTGLDDGCLCASKTASSVASPSPMINSIVGSRWLEKVSCSQIKSCSASLGGVCCRPKTVAGITFDPSISQWLFLPDNLIQ